ncbi:MAG: YitT family protein [Muribaculaceae bacterium]|nr:YitT family protein [Muribaculaceae bacterium]MBR6948325.1 YitT family protein [Muribaculaceae bacterium]
MTDKTKKALKIAQDYVMITLGLFTYAFGFTAFILPEKIVIGSVTGLSSLIHYWVGWNVALTYYAINIILLCIAFRSVGKQFVLRTIIGASISTLFIGVLQPMFPTPIIEQQTFMNVILGAVLCGLGLGVVFTHNGSTGGTDIIAAMVAKHSTISFGRTMMYCDVLIICSSYLLFHSIDKIVYGLIFMVIYSVAADRVINNTRQSVQFLIISKKWQQIADAINTAAHRGCTILDGTGWYTKESVKIIMVMCRKHESVNIFRIIKETDREAIITQSNCNAVYGFGFDELKVRVHSSKKKAVTGDTPNLPPSDNQ